MSTVETKQSRGSSIPVHEAHHDPDGEGVVSETVIEAVATAEAVDPTDCDLGLYGAVDLESLDTLFARRSGDGHWRFEFSVENWTVVVEGDGRVAVFEA
ncbi:HalOD1 output domain-containing protein [Halorussus lipolyticus]|uniref:HalOD1 output domain-containing protein n=1 Tax=Halorussus lipolyticus TaxID=3034024 RepID=UPI0023E7D04C|nr:HalOD1 output domain-containing protein [Halorussus sp. DT80]